jgi:replicative DNA helicase
MTEDTKNLEALYAQFLEHDNAQLARHRKDAQLAGQGINTGFKMFSRGADDTDKEVDLWIPKHAITMVCARTGGGKTTWMINLALRMVASGAQGMFITLEEPGFAIRSKLLAGYSRLTNPNHSMAGLSTWDALKVIQGKTEYDMGSFQKDVMRNVRIVDANTSVDLKHVESPTVMYQPQFIADLITVRNARAEKPLDFVIIDFGQLMESIDTDNSSSYMRMKAVMQALKNLAGTLGIAVVVGAQLKRECMALNIWEVQPEHVRDGSDMEHAASLIIATGQDDDYPDKQRNMVLRYLKNRNGPKRVGAMFNIDFESCYIPSQGGTPRNDA